MSFHDDFIIYFLLTRNANSIKFIERLFYVWLHTWNEQDTKIKFRNRIKMKNRNNMKCFSFLNAIELLFKNTKNTFDGKKIAFSQLEEAYLKNFCRNNKETRDKAIKVFELFLENKYVSENDKKKIRDFINNKN